jgi:hypothetical protein
LPVLQRIHFEISADSIDQSRADREGLRGW